jgi:hypothetical protein
MASQLPSGHPGDFQWRLALTRTLSSMRAVATEQVQAATAAAAKGGLFITHLVEAGASSDKVLTAYAVATGLPSAPRYETRNPPRELAARGDELQWRGVMAVPFATDGDKLCVAFAVPLPAQTLTHLPPHKAFVALEPEILHGLLHLYPAVRRIPSPSAPPPQSSAPQSPAPAPSVPSFSPSPPLPSLDFHAAAAPPQADPFALSPPGAAADPFAMPGPSAPAAPAPAPAVDPFSMAPLTVGLGPAPSAPGAPPPASEVPAQPAAAAPIPAPIPTGPVVPTDLHGFDPQAPAYPGAVLKPATIHLNTPSGEHAAANPPVPSGPQLPVPGNVVVDAAVPYQEDRYADLKGQLRLLRLPIAAVVGVVVLVKVGSCVIDSSRSEVEKKSAALADGIHASNVEAAKNRAAELRAEGARPEPERAEPTERVEAPVPRVAPLAVPELPSGKLAAGTFDSVTTALAEADLAARHTPAEFPDKCRALAAELRAYRQRTALPAREQADLANLTSEVAVACEREGSAGFGALRDRVSRALRGEEPTGGAGPRDQLNTPPEVEAAFSEIDMALARQDMPTACNRMGAAHSAVSDWMTRMPAGPRLARMAEAVASDFEELRYGCSRMSHSDAAARWSRLKKKLEP